MDNTKCYPVPNWVRTTFCVFALILLAAVVAMPYFGIVVPVPLVVIVGVISGNVAYMVFGLTPPLQAIADCINRQ